MNKIFKVIWNHATQSWVAVSEFTKAHGKTKSVSLSKVAVGVAAAVGLVEMSAAAVSEEIQGRVNVTNKALFIGTTANPAQNVLDNASNFKTISIGDNNVMRGGSIKIGYNISDQSTGRYGDVVIGNNIRVGGGAQDSLSVLLGNNAQVAGPSVAIGTGARADIRSTGGATSVGEGGIAIGAYSTIGGNIDGGTAVGTLAQAMATHAVAFGVGAGVFKGNERYDTAYKEGINWFENGGERSVSVGDYSAARGVGSVAIGTNTTTGVHAGNGPRMNAANAVSVGNSSSGLNQNSIAIGNATQAGIYNANTIAVIEANLTAAEAMLANLTARQAELGKYGTEEQGPDTAMEIALNEANLEKTRIQIARFKADLDKIKNDAADNGWNSIAIGNNSKALNQNTIAIGNSNNVTGNTSIAVGDRNIVTGNFSGAFGDPNTISGDRSYVLGNNNTVSGEGTFVVGNNVTATAGNNVILGNFSSESSATTGAGAPTAVDSGTVNGISYSGFAGDEVVKGIVSVGAADATRQIINVAPGEISPTSTDAINGSQLYLVAAKSQWTTNLTGDGQKLANTDDKDTVITDGQVNFGVDTTGLTVKKEVSTNDAGKTVVNYTYGIQHIDGES